MSASGIIRRSSRRANGTWASALLLLLILPVGASAYTLVLRSGRIVTIPENFTVTTSAVVYELSPGFNASVWLSNVDIAATERANREPAGSFAEKIARAREEGGDAPSATAAQKAGRKVVTNKDLEPSRLRRAAQEEEYERTRQERGLPSKEELQRRVEEQDRRLRELRAELEAARAEAELESLRSELAAVRRQLRELNLQLSQPPAASVGSFAAPGYYPYVYPPAVSVISVIPLGSHGLFRHRGFGLPRHHYGRPFGPHFGPRPGWPTPPVYGSAPNSVGGFSRAGVPAARPLPR